MRLCCWHFILLLLQLLLVCVLTCLILLLQHRGVDESWKWMLEAVLVCIIAPCATAAPVVTAKLGGDTQEMTSFTLLSSLVGSMLIPAVFPLLEPSSGVTFLTAFLVILHKMVQIIVLPLVLGFVVRHRGGPVRRFILSHHDLAFHCWCFSLSITAGITLRNILTAGSACYVLLFIALFTLLTAVFQHQLGCRIGRRYGVGVCAVQGMFQKNTALAIWVSWLYLSPLSSVGAGFYVLWQNAINSWELWRVRPSTSIEDHLQEVRQSSWKTSRDM